MNKKISSLAGIAILVVVAAAVALVLAYQNWTPNPVAKNTPTPIPMQSGTLAPTITPKPSIAVSGWQTYKDSDFGIEFQYLADVARVAKPNSNEIRIWFGKWGVGDGIGDLVIKKADSYEEKQSFGPDQQNPNTKLLDDFNLVAPTTTNEALTVFAWKVPNPMGGGNIIIVSTRIHQITFNDFMLNDADVKKTLKSIKWLLPEKTYRNQNLGFEFKYPGDAFLRATGNKVEIIRTGWEISRLYLSVEKTDKTLQQFITDYNQENNAYAAQAPAIKEYKSISFSGSSEAYHMVVDKIMMCCGDSVYYLKKDNKAYVIESLQLENRTLQVTQFKLLP